MCKDLTDSRKLNKFNMARKENVRQATERDESAEVDRRHERSDGPI